MFSASWYVGVTTSARTAPEPSELPAPLSGTAVELVEVEVGADQAEVAGRAPRCGLVGADLAGVVGLAPVVPDRRQDRRCRPTRAPRRGRESSALATPGSISM